ncbi:M48 family metallopeptidase [Cognatishimia sp. SS12]|uniref:M48 family metallopeptidase n=1 Tax=Cognatishimia sp. SS12 TaxID=2979465 RepID=UPI00232D5DCB|nr:M48 family metallopeptidase [Cognatishimia sp. SS12]MDC0738159.1 M48 family metallopeptidase [Cognatishimia sp. SS12]
MGPLRMVVTALIITALAGCDVTPVAAPAPASAPPSRNDISAIVARLAPVVQDSCETAAIVDNCRIRLYVAETRDGDANAFQSFDRFGRPFVLVTPQLLEKAQSADEIALVLAHEAAHHILGHLARQKEDAQFGATLLAEAAAEQGASPREIREARKIGAFVGARSFSQDYELEADALGALIAREAGFDPIRGVAFFLRIPDPGEDALSTHPSNAQRMAVVRQALRTGQGLN